VSRLSAYRLAGRRSKFAARHFFAEADRFGVGRHGISLPIRGANGERAIFSVTSDVTEQAWTTQRVVCLRDLQMIGHLVHDRAIRVAGFSLALPKSPLSGREVQCLEAIRYPIGRKQGNYQIW